MKKRFFLLSMLAMLLLSFKPNTETIDLKVIETSMTTIPENTDNSVTTEEITENSIPIPFQIHITWVGDAAYGVPGYQAVRAERRAFYATIGKQPLEAILDNNNAIWTFIDHSKNDLRATIEQDPDVCEDSECDD